MALHVYKFGGTSVGSVAAIGSVIRIVQSATPANQIAIVVSAMSGVTDALLRGAHTAAAGDGATYLSIAQDLRLRHQITAQELIASEAERDALEVEIDRLLGEFTTLCHSIHVLG